MLVTAGAGTGKTHVLIARLAHLIEGHRIPPGHGVLVLSFSRAAVREIRSRVAAWKGDVAYARVQTFDSFATRLLLEISPETDLSSTTYDDRIQMTVDLIRQGEAAQAEIAEFEHILVDEVQDLVGVRSELVKTVLEFAQGGFTLLGDPAQGIYSFQAEGEARRIGSAALYQWIRGRFGDQLIEKTLATNHRVASNESKIGLFAGERLNGPSPDYAQILFGLRTALMRVDSLGTIDEAVPFLQPYKPGRTAILCQTNGQALQISRRLSEAGLCHRLKRSATDRVIPAWIALVLANLEHPMISRSRFCDRARELGHDSMPEENEAWSILSRIGGGPDEQLDVRYLAERIRTGNVPDELLAPFELDPIIVSTIHRAKGLEFERVVVVDFHIKPKEDDDDAIAETARLLYVAMTRPKNELFHLAAPDVRGMRTSRIGGRWIRTDRRRRLVDVEVRGEDVHWDEPAGGFLLDGCDPVQTQSYIASSVRSGDSVTLRLVNDVAPESMPYYLIDHCGHPVGVTSERFANDLSHLLRGWGDAQGAPWPRQIQELHVEDVDTVAGMPATGECCGLGAGGIWLRARVAGLGGLTSWK